MVAPARAVALIPRSYGSALSKWTGQSIAAGKLVFPVASSDDYASDSVPERRPRRPPANRYRGILASGSGHDGPAGDHSVGHGLRHGSLTSQWAAAWLEGRCRLEKPTACV